MLRFPQPGFHGHWLPVGLVVMPNCPASLKKVPATTFTKDAITSRSILLVVGYMTYGNWLSKEWGVDPNRETPAVRTARPR